MADKADTLEETDAEAQRWYRRYLKADAEVERLKATHAREADEFNRGFKAYGDGVAYDDEPDDITEDQWHPGWAWAAFEPLRVKCRVAERVVKGHKTVLETTETENKRLNALIDGLKATQGIHYGAEVAGLREQSAKWEGLALERWQEIERLRKMHLEIEGEAITCPNCGWNAMKRTVTERTPDKPEAG